MILEYVEKSGMLGTPSNLNIFGYVVFRPIN